MSRAWPPARSGSRRWLVPCADLVRLSSPRVQSAGAALEELLVAAKKQDYITVGVYESAKVMNV